MKYLWTRQPHGRIAISPTSKLSSRSLDTRIIAGKLAIEFVELIGQLEDDASRDRACRLYWGMGSLPQHCGGDAA